jgi:hypothetical protein
VLDLRRRAAEQFLRSGHVDEALPTVERVLTDVGLRIPATPALSVASLLLQRGKLRLRGLDFVERCSVPEEALRKIDICWALGNGMGGVDVIRGADFQARHLWLALKAGEPYRIARALSWESILLSIEGGASCLARADAVSARACALAKRIDHPHALAWAIASEAIRRFCLGHWKAARSLSEETLVLFREHCADIGWETGSMEMWWLLPSLRWMGEYKPLELGAGLCAKAAIERGDLYTEAGVRTHVAPYLRIMEGRPAEGVREAKEALARLSRDRWLTQHWCAAVSTANAELYAGQLGAALAGVERDGRRMERALQTRLQTMRLQFADARGRIFVTAAREDRRRRTSLLESASHDASALEKENLGWPSAFAKAIRAGIAHVRGQEERARSGYLEAERAFADLDMAVHALAAKAKRCALEGQREAREDIFASVGARGVREPERYLEMLVP